MGIERKNMSKLDRYANKEKRMKYVQDYNKSKYQYVMLTLSKEKDAEMLFELNKAKSKTALVRKWYANCKK